MDLAKVKEAFERHGFAVSYFETAAEARAYLAAQCAGQAVTFGGSVTLDQLGAFDALTAAGCTVNWHWKNGGARVQDCDIYVTSANGLSETGEIVNIDGTGNRVAAAIYGPAACFTVCGRNKLAPTLADAIGRARNIAAPKNAQRLHAKTPCAVKADHCYDCKSPGRICRALTVLWGAMMGSDMEVMLVNEDLGY